MELIPAKSGPISKYDPSVCDKIVEAALQGGHIPAMMMAAGIRSKDTWYRWINEYPEFKEAVEYAKLASQAVWESIGLKGTIGEIKNFNATSFALTMNNKFGDEYKRSTGGSNTEITLNTVNYTSEEVNQKIAQKLEKLKSLGIDLNGSEPQGSDRTIRVVGSERE